MKYEVLSNEEQIKYIERKLNEIFGKFENIDLDNMTLYAVVYKYTIKFVSIDLKEEVDLLISMYNDLVYRNCNIKKSKKIKNSR